MFIVHIVADSLLKCVKHSPILFHIQVKVQEQECSLHLVTCDSWELPSGRTSKSAKEQLRTPTFLYKSVFESCSPIALGLQDLNENLITYNL